MLAEIASNPVAWPLWGVFLFAATMFPLGFMLPGCACCGGGNCTTCGILDQPQGNQQNAHGRMCCTGTIAPSVTLRVTSVGPSPPVVVSRGTGTTYSRTSATFNCSAINGDYVIPLVKQTTGLGETCDWAVDAYPSCLSQLAISLTPRGTDLDDSSQSSIVPYPGWYLTMTIFKKTIPGSFRFQSCSGFPEVESCNVGTTLSSEGWLINSVAFSGGGLVPKVFLSEEKCSLAGVVIAASQKFSVSQRCEDGITYGSLDTGCEFRMEFV